MDGDNRMNKDVIICFLIGSVVGVIVGCFFGVKSAIDEHFRGK